MRPDNTKGWEKGKSKGINGMMPEYGSDASPPILGAMSNEARWSDSQAEYNDWAGQEEWPSRLVGKLFALRRGKNNLEMNTTEKEENEKEEEGEC